MSQENIEKKPVVDEEDPTFVTDKKADGSTDDMQPPRSQSPTDLKKDASPEKSEVNEEEERARKRQEQAVMFEKYIEESGLSLSF
jgi:hypothetical protein